MNWKLIFGIGIFVAIVILYFVTYAINEKTEKPEGCEDLECTSCNARNCSHRQL